MHRRWRGTGPRPTVRGAVFRPRDLPVTGARGPVPRDLPVDCSMARDRPSPYGEGGRFSTKRPSRYCSAGACPPRVSGRPQHGEGQALALRGRVPFFAQEIPVTVARGPVPREFPVDRSMARDRPSPYAAGCRFSPQRPSCYRSAGACPPRASGRPQHGEGQALAR